MKDLKICVIGAGISGLCAARHLTQKGFKNIHIFEATSRIGGTWNYEPDVNYPNAMYKNLTTNLPHSLMQYPDYQFPSALSTIQYPHHSVVLQYIQNYAAHFNLYPFIKYHHKIIKVIAPQVAKVSDTLPKWNVYVESNSCMHKYEFDSVIVCNGHYTKPYIPDFVGLNSFKKCVIHSRYYREPQPEVFDNKVVVIVGYRSSGKDIAIEIFHSCENVTVYQVTHGVKVTKETHYKYYVAHDRFRYKENINKFGDESLEFNDGAVIYPDVVIFCTGYLYDFEPFLDNMSLKDFTFGTSVNGLFQHVVYPHIPSLFFVCLSLQVVPCLIAHVQCLWIANILSDLHCTKTGEYKSEYIPNKHDMLQWINSEGHNCGEKEQFVLGLKQFEYIKHVCLLSKQAVPANLDELKFMYANKNKPIPSLNRSKL